MVGFLLSYGCSYDIYSLHISFVLSWKQHFASRTHYDNVHALEVGRLFDILIGDTPGKQHSQGVFAQSRYFKIGWQNIIN